MKIAIVGGGPRGLWACETLTQRCREYGAHVEVDLYEPGHPGAGSVYRSDQPDYWRLNVDAALLRTCLGSFTEWREDQGYSTEHFPPRREVGDFLSASWTHLLGTLPPHMSLTHHRAVVEDIRKNDDGAWVVKGRPYDEVLIATGHAHSWPGSLHLLHPSPRRPILNALSPNHLDSIPAGSVVAIRGAALTFIDAVLALTLGRGGSFHTSESSENASALGYRSSGHEPKRILPVSRGGRFMCVKPDPEGKLVDRHHVRLLHRFRPAVVRAGSLVSLKRTLASAASELLAHQGIAESTGVLLSTIDGHCEPGDPVEELRHSLNVATGHVSPDKSWALGAAWRLLYPEIVDRASYGGRASLPGFDELAQRMERIAFGPIPSNAARLLALIDSGHLDPSLLGRPELVDDLLADAPPGSAIEVDAIIDAVSAPPGPHSGTLINSIVQYDHNPGAETPSPLTVGSDGRIANFAHFAVVGRDTEGTTLGNDTLSRKLHSDIDVWARGIAKAAVSRSITRRAHGLPRLTARVEPWMVELLSAPQRCDEVIEAFGSPTNVHNPELLASNADELTAAGHKCGVPVRVHFARKANKSLAFVDAALSAGHGVDVSSGNELAQVLDRGVPAERIILSSAIKPSALLSLAISHGVTISVDSERELERVSVIARQVQKPAYVAPRLAPDPARMPPTRFGQRSQEWKATLSGAQINGVVVVGIHAHLHGYLARDRAIALEEALDLTDYLASRDHRLEFIDLGGGVPMSYLEDENEWEEFLIANTRASTGDGTSFTWNDKPLKGFYPFYQQPTRGTWLIELLRTELMVGGMRTTAAAHLGERGLRLHLEPGRALLDGCGLILARVAFVKKRSDGVPLIGVEMNRTQCRTTSDDILVDPILVPTSEAPRPSPAEGYLVGAYCIEDEIIIKRKMYFPDGVTEGDLIAIPNTAGYFMHILESASHQIPLANNVVYSSDRGAVADDIDSWAAH